MSTNSNSYPDILHQNKGCILSIICTFDCVYIHVRCPRYLPILGEQRYVNDFLNKLSVYLRRYAIGTSLQKSVAAIMQYFCRLGAFYH